MTLTIPLSAALSFSDCSILMIEYIIEVGINENLLLEDMIHLFVIQFDCSFKAETVHSGTKIDYGLFEFHICLCSLRVSPAGDPQWIYYP